MYEIYADDLLIHSDITPLESKKAVNPHLVLEDSGAGSLEFVLPPMNDGYSQDVVKRMVTDIVVKCDGEFLWGGRILQDSFDFWNNRKIMCEGELAFLNDSIQPPRKYLSTETTIESFLYSLIDIHNAQVGENRQFKKGMVTVTDGDQQDDSDAIYRFTNYETTLTCINDKLVDRLKGHLRVRHAIDPETNKDARYIDYISDDTLDTNSQIVRFGVNLLDFSKNIDMTELATVICPRGNRLDINESDPRYIEGLEPYLTVETLEGNIDDEGNVTADTDKIWHQDKSMFVKNPTAVGNFGWVPSVVDWQNVSDATTLFKKAVKYLKDEQYEKMTLEIQAFDLKYLQNGDAPIKFLTKLRCISEPHGMDHTFIVSKMDIDLTNPGNSIYTLGSDVKLSLTQATTKVNQAVLDEIERIPSKNEILRAAQENAFNILMGKDGGYVRFEKYPGTDVIHSIVISNAALDEDSTRKWVWDEGGLGHLTRESTADPWQASGLNVAITMDGKINCDYLYGGKIYGQEIEGCTINGGTINGTTITSKYGNSTSQYAEINGGSVIVHDTADNFLKVVANDDNSKFLTLGSRHIACMRGSHYIELDTYDIMEYLANHINT